MIVLLKRFEGVEASAEPIFAAKKEVFLDETNEKPSSQGRFGGMAFLFLRILEKT